MPRPHRRSSGIATVGSAFLVVLFAFGLQAAASDIQKVKEVLKNRDTRQVLHKHFSAHCFNECWKHIDKKVRNADDTEDMIALAYASLWHWKQREDCRPQNLSIAYWQLGRVHALANNLALATHFGQKCVVVSVKCKLSPFAVGYGYEALLRASILGKRFDDAKSHLKKAEEQLRQITDQDERGLLSNDIEELRKMIPK